MGCFSYVRVSHQHLPEELHGYTEEGWRTKTFDDAYERYAIDKNGTLLMEEREFDTTSNPPHALRVPKGYKPLDYTGELRYYDNVGGVWWEFVVLFDHGKLIAQVQVVPEKAGG